MNEEGEKDPVCFLLDETEPASCHPTLIEGMRKLNTQGIPTKLLFIPCPDQPTHPFLPEAGPYCPWVGDALPPHRAVVATSLSTAVLAACYTNRGAYWLLDRNPFTEYEDRPMERALLPALLQTGLVRAVAANPVLAESLQQRHGIGAEMSHLIPARPVVPRAAPGNSMPTTVVDHSSSVSDDVILSAASLNGLSARVVLLTELLAPPYAWAFSKVRTRSFCRSRHYTDAALIVRLDSFHDAMGSLALMFASGATVATTRAALGRLPVNHPHEVWCFSDPDDPVCIRRETELLLRNPELRTAISARAQATYKRWRQQSEESSWEPGEGAEEHRAAPPADMVARILTSPRAAVWNTSVLRLLSSYYDTRRRQGERNTPRRRGSRPSRRPVAPGNHCRGA